MAKESDDKRRRLLNIALGMGLVFFVVLIFMFISNIFANFNSNKESRKFINEAVARQLNKAPDELTSKDYQRIEKLSLTGYRITNIKLVEKCKNLQYISLSYIRCTNLKPLAKLKTLKILKICFLQSPDRPKSK